MSFDEQHRDRVQAKLFGRLILGLNSVWLPQSFDKDKQYHYQNSVLGALAFLLLLVLLKIIMHSIEQLHFYKKFICIRSSILEGFLFFF